MKNKDKKFDIRSLASGLCLILVLALLISTVAQKASGQIPLLFGWGRAIVVSGSMEPEIPVGAMVIFREQKDYDLGDVITFHDSSGKLITHRILSISDDWLITKGDRNNASDEPIGYDQIVGKVHVILPGVGQVMNFFSQPGTIIGILAVLGIVLLLPVKNPKEGEKNYESFS